MQKNDQYLKVAIKAATYCGKIFKTFFGQAKHITNKGGNPRDFLTEVDVRLEKHIRGEISANFPSHKIIGEEMGSDIVGKKDLFWIIDPIDGTTNFIHGIPICCISLALWDNNGPLIAVVFNPITDELYTATRGKGAKLNGKKITVSKTSELSNGYGAVGWGRDVKMGTKIFPFMVEISNKVRILGSCALELCLLASGHIDHYVHGSMKIWDAAAGMLIATEAGGKFTDWQGKKPTLEIKQFLAGNNKIHKELLVKFKNLS